MAYPTNNKTGAQNLVDLVLAIRDAQGQRGSLTTTDKDSLVDAINEVNDQLSAIRGQIESKSQIDDSLTTAINTWSALKISNTVAEKLAELKNELLGGAGADFDTLQELVTLINQNKGAIEALETIAAGHVRFNAAQSLTANEKAQARSNIGAPSTDDVADAKKAGTDASAALETFKGEVGNPHIDLVSIFNNGVSA